MGTSILSSKNCDYFFLSIISCNNISNKRHSVSSGYPNTKNRVENTTHNGVFLTKFEVFGHCLGYLIYLLN